MMFFNDLHLSSFVIFALHLVFTEAIKMPLNHTMINSTFTTNMTIPQNVTTIVTTQKNFFNQGKEFIHSRINKMNQNTLLWSTIAVATIVCLVSIYIAMKTFA
jgi:hypothetical protein